MVSSSFKTSLNVQILSHTIHQPLQWWSVVVYVAILGGKYRLCWSTLACTRCDIYECWESRKSPGCETAGNQCRHAKPNNNTDIYSLSPSLFCYSFCLSVSPSLRSLWFSSFLRGAAHLHIWWNLIILLPPPHTDLLHSYFRFFLSASSLYTLLKSSFFFFFFCERPPWVKLHCFTNSIKRLIYNLRAGQFSEQSFFLCPTGNPAKASKCCSNRPWITINPAWLDLPIVIPVLREQARPETAGVEKRDNWSEREGERMI